MEGRHGCAQRCGDRPSGRLRDLRAAVLLFPAYATTLTQQMPLPENYTLRALGIAFVMLGYLEFQVARDLERYRSLAMTFGLTSALFFITIALQLMLTGFNGALWYWWVNLVVSGVFAIAVLSACRRRA